MAGILAVLLAIGMIAGGVAPAASAADSRHDYLQIDKRVDNAAPQPGQTFTYTIKVTCSEQDCVNAKLSDTFPAALAGFDVEDVAVTPATTPATITWSDTASPTPPSKIGADTTVSAEIDQTGDSSMAAGSTFSIIVSLRVPDDFPVGDSGPIVNAATATADNANTVTSEATIDINVAESIDVDVVKTWNPTNETYAPGRASTISLEVGNASNVDVDSLVIQEPKAAVDGAPGLDPSNPATITDFAGFSHVSLPAGCTAAQVDVYVFDGSSWHWRTGPPVTPAALTLPAGVANGDVGGYRVTCTGVIAPGQKLTFDTSVTQRSTDRNTGADLSTGTHTVDNVASGSTTKGAQTSAKDATASHTVAPVIPTVEAHKSIVRDRITAGQSATGSISGTNGAVPVSELRLADLGFFTADVTFGGFTAAPEWPSGATTAAVVSHLLDGTTETRPFAKGTVPPASSGPISGFELVYRGDAIEPSTSGGASFTIDTTTDATKGAPQLALKNTVDVDVTAANGQKAKDDASAPLTVIDPAIDVTIDKSIRPGSVVPGEKAVASLVTQAKGLGDDSVVHDIVVTDAWDGSKGAFWDAFGFDSVAPTQVPADTRLTIEVRTADGTWVTLAVAPAQGAASLYQLSPADTAAALAAARISGSDVEGVRFSFHNEDGFPSDTTVSPNPVFQANSDLRTGGTSTPGGASAKYVNTATADADGESAGGKPLHDHDEDKTPATIDPIDPIGPNGIDVEKSWDRATVSAQSGDQPHTHLDWRVVEGFDPVTITDAAGGFDTPQSTVFDAFDLKSIAAIPVSSDPYTNGWYLRYDTVTDVQLYYAGAWHSVAHTGDWMGADRSFTGYTLTADESALTTGVRIVLQETSADEAARTAARASSDPLAPAPGTGVGASERFRTFDLGWQLRDITRSSGAIISSHSAVNVAGDPGVVDNTVRGEGQRSNGDVVRDEADAKIAIVDQAPAAKSTKTVSDAGTDMFVPVKSTPQESYPTATWTLTGWNASVSKATYVRLTDPAPCADTDLAACESDVSAAKADPFDTGKNSLTDAGIPNPFERFTLTKLTIGASIPTEVDLDASPVWLLHYAGGTYTTTRTTAAIANAMTPAELADVVGVSATFDGASDHGTGRITQDNRLSIVMDTQLRATLRSSGAAQVLRAGDTVDVANRVFAQSYDPVISPGTKTGAIADATKTLVGGDVNIAPSKSITPEVLDEPSASSTPITVTLGADQGANPRGTLAPSRVVIEDQSASTDFWNAFDFTGFGALTLPAGADRVQIDAFAGAAWVLGTPDTAAALPAGVTADQVQGLRITFTRADGGLFSTNVPADNWSGSVAFAAVLRPIDRATGAKVVFDHTIDNTQTSQSFRPDGNNSSPRDATAQVALESGSHELAVNKLTNGGKRVAGVGDQVPFDLTLTNTGTGYLNLTTVTDALPAQLAYTDPATTTFTKDAGGTLSDEVTVTPAEDGRSLSFTWPAGGNVMKPGETFRIRVFLELQPGLAQGAVATNTMTVATEQLLDVCRNTQSGGSTTSAWANDAKTCGTTDTVGAVTGSNLFTAKGVQGSLAGAGNPANPAFSCAATLDVDGERYFRAPCVANSEIDGVDNWVLHNVNAGTIPVTSMTVFDQLPTPGDSFIIAGSSRGSMYRPELVADSLKLSVPAGTTQKIEVTTTTGACQGTWGQLPMGTPCTQNGEAWAAATDATDWSAVTGIRITLDFTTTAAGALAPGQAADVTYSTVNRIRTADRADGASQVVPAGNQVAVNQYGLTFRFAGENAPRKIAPREAAVRLRVGSIAVVKKITGPAADYAPESFQASVVCTAGGAPLDLGAHATVTLSRENGYRVDLTGIPLSANGTSCTVAELGDRGAYGETSRSGSPATVAVNVAAPQDGSEAEIPVEQTVTLTNDYRFTGLALTKKVETSATGATFGPFAFTLTCTTATGAPVTFTDAGDVSQTFTLVDGGTWTAPSDRIPVGASCRVTESGSSFADHIVIVGDNVVDDGDGSATVTPGTDPAHVTVTNGYDAGTLTVAKKVTGAGADRYGAGPFGFAAVCTYHGQTLLDETFMLERDATRTFAPFPAGTSCAVTEQKTGGATDATLDPADGIVTIAAGAAGTPVGAVTVTATNRFDLASFDVVKKREGNLLNPGAAGPFTVSAVCTYIVDGVTTPIDVPGGAERLLTADNAYRASYADLPAGASCEVTETTTGHADATTITVDDGDPVPGTTTTVALSGEDTPTVTVTNTFTAGRITVAKTVSGTDSAAHTGDVFGVTLVCTWYGEDLAIPGGAVRDLTVGNTVTYTDLPTGAECVLTESHTGGAKKVSVTIDGSVAAGPAGMTIGKDTTTAVTIDNRFDRDLPATGGDDLFVRTAAWLGLALLLSGATIVVLRRRRES